MAGIADRKARRGIREVFSDPRLRSSLLQLVLLLVIVWLGWTFFDNARQNLAAQKIATGFGFLWETASFAVSQSLIPYNEAASYGRAFLVGLLNTLLVSALGIVFATLIGFAVGIARLSGNILLARVAGAYVEALRNLPLLFQILFWYLAVLGTLPGPRESEALLGIFHFTNRGILMPQLILEPGAGLVVGALAAAIVASFALARWGRHRTAEAGARIPWGVASAAILILLPLAAYAIAGAPIELEFPELRGFNFVGGFRVNPEFLALLFALATYTAAFIAEIVRAGFLAVPRGQFEAAASLGLRRRATLRLVVAPQAMRLIVPPLTSQYLNLTKNSSLAAAIGYPDFFYVFAGTTLNQTGQAIEIVAITMAVYLVISLVTAVLMNWYNRAVALKGA
jgi:general L-amino acid transport system permease protein